MRHRQMVKQGLKGLFLIMFILVSCSAPSDDGTGGGCGGSNASITCLDVTGITPTSLDEDTTNVDALLNQCRDPVTGAVTGIEPFGDHNADVTLVNRQFPTSTATDRAFDIRIIGYSVTYSLNPGGCLPAARGCPPLTGLTVSGESIVIPAGQTLTITLPFVPLSRKNEYVQAGGELGIAAPSYTTTYTFTAQTIGLVDTFTVQGRAPFTITNFDNCT
jgi:hypothetical protein